MIAGNPSFELGGHDGGRRAGDDVTVVTWGNCIEQSLAAADALADEVSVEVIDLRSLRPLDTETILESVMKTGKVLIAHEANRFGGIGAEVAAIIAEEAFAWLDGPITRVAAPEAPAMAYSQPLEHAFLPNKETIGAVLDRLAAF